MTEKRLKIPRASIGVQTIDDSDFIALTEMEGGWSAFGVFTAMVILCRDESTDTLKIANIQRRLGLSSDQIQDAIKLIDKACESNGNETWFEINQTGIKPESKSNQSLIKVRNFYKWNPIEKRGGKRPGAGRKPEKSKR